MPHAASPAGVQPRSILLDLFRVALDAVDGARAVQRALDDALQSPHGPTRPPRWQGFAVGKAAASMWCGARAALGSRLERGLVIVPDDDPYAARAAAAGAEVLHAAHPVPDSRSVAAGARLLEAVASLPADVQPLFLVSGGSSSLVELPRDGVTLDDLRAAGAAGLAAGLPIGELNRRRAALSQLKGGGLTLALRSRPALALFVSDVPDDDTGVIGSGLLAARPGDRVERRIVASLAQALAAVEAAAGRLGLAVTREPARLVGAAAEQGTRLAAALVAGPAGLLLAGGETTVTLPPHPGRGGRNQQLALAAALRLSGSADCTLLACGTDGIDGASGDAGAVVDGDSCARIRDAGLDPQRQLAQADAGTALEAAGDLVHTGPTGTNVCDIVMGLKL
jgi:hydroxypyruvate reductase